MNKPLCLATVFCLAAYATAQTLPKTKKSDMNELAPAEVAISLDNVPLTAAQLAAILPKNLFTDTQTPNAGESHTVIPSQPKPIRAFLQKMVGRALLRKEAMRLEISVTPEERARYTAEIESSLKKRNPPIEMKEYLKQYTDKPDGWFQFSFDDAMLVAKFNEQLFAPIKVTEQELAEAVEAYTQQNTRIKEINDFVRNKMLEVLDDAAIETDKGFASLAKDNSEGREGSSGGTLGEFPRSVVAKANGLDSFTLKKGEITGLLETPTAFRIIRVLEVLPPKKEGDEEWVKIAQIILRKLQLTNTDNIDTIKNKLLSYKQTTAVEKCVRELAAKADLKCPLFKTDLFAQEPEK